MHLLQKASHTSSPNLRCTLNCTILEMSASQVSAELCCTGNGSFSLGLGWVWLGYCNKTLQTTSLSVAGIYVPFWRPVQIHSQMPAVTVPAFWAVLSQRPHVAEHEAAPWVPSVRTLTPLLEHSVFMTQSPPASHASR